MLNSTVVYSGWNLISYFGTCWTIKRSFGVEGEFNLKNTGTTNTYLRVSVGENLGCGLAVLGVRISHKDETRCWPGLQHWNAWLQEDSRPSVLTWSLAGFSSSWSFWSEAFSSLLRIQFLPGCWLETSLSSLTFKARRIQFCPGVGTSALINWFVKRYLCGVKISCIAFVFLVHDGGLKSMYARCEFSGWYTFLVCI